MDLISCVHAGSDDREPTGVLGSGAGRRRPVPAAEHGSGLVGVMKSSDSDPDSAWDRVRQLRRGTGDLPRWFVQGRRELDGARGGGGGSGRREHAGMQACGCAGAGTVRKWARGACARHRQACVGVVRPGAVPWQAHRGELRRGSTGGGVPAPGMAYVPRHLAQKVKGVIGLLTEARV